MPDLDPISARTITTRGFSRLTYGLVLAIGALVIAGFMWWSVESYHGIYAAVLLVIGATALALVGGPEKRARSVTVGPEEIRIDRFHRVSTVIDRSELASVSAESATGRHGRTRAVLVLTPHDPGAFFTRHRELRSVRQGDAAHVPAGTSADTVSKLTEALT
ncbi:MAG: hypothetical protein Q4F67_06415 [Propionibacteriaceae bacterium]|nr:hypothetical protein [Propionibacteriaceae bacterium]